ncbi:hypothetical protein emb_1c0039 [Coriobacteriaceae bacterium EMTCatB1]|nr:hypothetical protein emb_1c0039 [Coriobacteriaceae bacterium EMTCatB1]
MTGLRAVRAAPVILAWMGLQGTHDRIEATDCVFEILAWMGLQGTHDRDAARKRPSRDLSMDGFAGNP